MTARRQLLVVSNRGPVGYARDERGARVASRGAGGLVTALAGLVSHHDVTWIASAMSDEDRAVAAEAGGRPVDETARDGSPYRLRLVAHDPDVYDRFYNVVANPVLWFAQHHLWDLKRTPSLDAEFHRAWACYAEVNRTFAVAVAEELERAPGATVFLHDYHLYLAPRLVREARPDALIAMFVHIPWPDSEGWSVLPEPIRRDVHASLLATDVLGFHTERWARNFRRSCRDVLGADADEATLVTAHAISVDPAEFAGLARSDEVLERERGLLADRPERLLVRVDRTDPAKNVVRGFRAFEAYLDTHPEARGRVRMLALLDPSRQDVAEYEDYLAEIERTVAEVNERFGGAIDLRVRNDFAESVAAYKQFDVLLVNAVYDGCNLVAKEAPLVNERDGVVVLSENAGAHEELAPWALTVNPFDLAGQADAIHRALELPADERRRRLDGIRGHVREHDLAHWLEAQLADCDRAAERRRMRA